MRQLELKRRLAGMTQAQAAAQVPMARTDWSLVESGRLVPTPRMAEKIGRLFGGDAYTCYALLEEVSPQEIGPGELQA